MSLFNELTKKNLKLNKKRTVVTIIGIILSVALLTAVTTMYSSFIQALIDYEVYHRGNFHIGYIDVPKEDIEVIRNNRNVEGVHIVETDGYARLDGVKNEYKPYACIKRMNKSALENMAVRLVEGRLPEKADEIVIPTHLKTNGRVSLSVGESITLNVGTRVSEGYELDQSNPFNPEEEEEITGQQSRTYKIVGIVERPPVSVEPYSAPGYTFITLMEEDKVNEKADVYVKYYKKNTETYINATAEILNIDKKIAAKGFSAGELSKEELDEVSKEFEKAKYRIETNEYLFVLESNPFKENTVAGIGTVAIIVCGIIVFTSVFCIRNSFEISISEKYKQFGMLRSIGATRKQIRRNVLYEASILGAIGIPIGVASGILASGVLLAVCNTLLGTMLVEGMTLRLTFRLWAILIAVALGMITIYFSALKSAISASRVSPVESIRNSAGIHIKKNKTETPRLVSRLFGIGGVISYKNLKRNKKKYRTTVISVAVSVMTFITITYFMSLAFQAVEAEIGTNEYNYSISIRDVDEKTFDDLMQTLTWEETKECSLLYCLDASIENPKFSDKAKELYGEDIENELSTLMVVGLTDSQYSSFLKENGLKAEDLRGRAVLCDTSIDIVRKDDKDVKIKYRMYSYEAGNSFTIFEYDERIKAEIGAVLEDVPFGLEDSYYSFSGMIIYPKSTFTEEFESLKNRFRIRAFYNSTDADKLQDKIEELMSGADYMENNTNENYRMMKNFYLLIGIFFYGFIIVISLIGITNIFNTITTGMSLRRREFAMLKSIGMTGKEFNRLIRLESIFVCAKSLIFSIPVGLVLSYLLYRSWGADMGLKYEPPVIPVACAVAAVFMLIYTIMHYSVKVIEKQNIIETIRNENI